MEITRGRPDIDALIEDGGADFIRDEAEIEEGGPRRNPYVDYSQLGQVVEGVVAYPATHCGIPGCVDNATAVLVVRTYERDTPVKKDVCELHWKLIARIVNTRSRTT